MPPEIGENELVFHLHAVHFLQQNLLPAIAGALGRPVNSLSELSIQDSQALKWEKIVEPCLDAMVREPFFTAFQAEYGGAMAAATETLNAELAKTEQARRNRSLLG